MRYVIEVADEPQRPIAAVAEATSWERFGGQWFGRQCRGMLDEVYSCLRQAGASGGCNVMLYRDLPEEGRVAVEVGVEVSGPFAPAGRVHASALPAGPTVMTVHHGRYEKLGVAHQAILRWCGSQGWEVTGERWEVYGDWHDDPALLETRVYHRLRG